MKIQVAHIVDLLEYLHDEGVRTVDVQDVQSLGEGLTVSFLDKDDCECQITIFQESFNKNPRLNKLGMDVRSRIERKLMKEIEIEQRAKSIMNDLSASEEKPTEDKSEPETK